MQCIELYEIEEKVSDNDKEKSPYDQTFEELQGTKYDIDIEKKTYDDLRNKIQNDAKKKRREDAILKLRRRRRAGVVFRHLKNISDSRGYVWTQEEIETWNKVIRPFVREFMREFIQSIQDEAERDTMTWNQLPTHVRMREISRFENQIINNATESIFGDKNTLREDAFIMIVKRIELDKQNKQEQLRKERLKRYQNQETMKKIKKKISYSVKIGLTGGFIFALIDFILFLADVSIDFTGQYCATHIMTYCNSEQVVKPTIFCDRFDVVDKPICFIKNNFIYPDSDQFDMSKQSDFDKVQLLRKNGSWLAFGHLIDDKTMEADISKTYPLNPLVIENFQQPPMDNLFDADQFVKNMNYITNKAYDALPENIKNGIPITSDSRYKQLETILTVFIVNLDQPLKFNMLTDIHILNVMASGKNDTSIEDASQIMGILNSLRRLPSDDKKQRIISIILITFIILCVGVIILFW